ncbi:hypothetical protein K402DRAFT_419501 [Aulographum hederae CBS 113979]|uniref:Uncharacterized protein n=1 Tax=Aulographum hederae CBS 113979 TaxID=1176131 RepID=A0A6G1H541_9PEZI|nr:hypothetical protein K402DRAFT_419501 [Aulographum hederae CBS 113979]
MEDTCAAAEAQVLAKTTSDQKLAQMLLVRLVVPAACENTAQTSDFYRQIGAGCCGTVFEDRQGQFGTARAIKVAKVSNYSLWKADELWNDYKVHTFILE